LPAFLFLLLLPPALGLLEVMQTQTTQASVPLAPILICTGNLSSLFRQVP
jgi:hypothetical protein